MRAFMLTVVLLLVGGACAPSATLAQTNAPPAPPKPTLTISQTDGLQTVRFDDSRAADTATFSIGVEPAPDTETDPPPPRVAVQGDLISVEKRRLPRRNVSITELKWDGVAHFQATVQITPPKNAKPGRYTGTVSFGGPSYAAPLSVSVAASLRSNIGWAVLIALAGWIAGVIVKGLSDLFATPGERIRSKTSIRKYFLREGFIVTAALGLVGAGAAWAFGYLANEVWAADADGVKLFFTALACVVTGTTLADFATPFKGGDPPA